MEQREILAHEYAENEARWEAAEAAGELAYQAAMSGQKVSQGELNKVYDKVYKETYQKAYQAALSGEVANLANADESYEETSESVPSDIENIARWEASKAVYDASYQASMEGKEFSIADARRVGDKAYEDAIRRETEKAKKNIVEDHEIMSSNNENAKSMPSSIESIAESEAKMAVFNAVYQANRDGKQLSQGEIDKIYNQAYEYAIFRETEKNRETMPESQQQAYASVDSVRVTESTSAPILAAGLIGFLLGAVVMFLFCRMKIGTIRIKIERDAPTKERKEKPSKNKMHLSFFSFLSLLISIGGFLMFIVIGGNFHVWWVRSIWIISGITALIFPIGAKAVRVREKTKGKSLEIIALIIGFFDFNFVLMYNTTWDGTLIFVLALIPCILYAKLFNPKKE